MTPSLHPGLQNVLAKGRTRTAAGATSSDAPGNRSLLARIFPSPAQPEPKSPDWQRPPAIAPPDLQPRRAGKYALRLRRKEERADPDGFSRAAADAVGVGGREALGVRQLAAALFSCANNVPGTGSA